MYWSFALSLSPSKPWGGMENTSAFLVAWQTKYTSKRVESTLQRVERGEITPFLPPALLAEVSTACHLQSLVDESGALEIWGCSLLQWCPIECLHPLLSPTEWWVYPAWATVFTNASSGMRVPPRELLLQCWSPLKERFNPCHQNKTLCVCFFTLRNCQD